MRDLHDSIGLVGIHGHPRAARAVGRGLRALVARGGRSAGIVAFGDAPRSRREPHLGFLHDEPALDALLGPVALGQLHGRDTPDAEVGLVDGVRLPRRATVAGLPVALAVSGGLVGAARLRDELSDGGAALDGDGPEELLLHLMARSRQRTPVNRLADALWRIDGGFAVVLAAPGLLVGARDRFGLRPLVLGRLDNAAVLASDDAAIRAMGGVAVRAVLPGEMVVVDDKGVASVRPLPPREPAPCVQELAQLALPGSSVEGGSAWSARVALGEELARERPADVALVVAAGEAAQPAAVGYARQLGRPLEPALVGTGPDLRGIPDVLGGRAVALVVAGVSEAVRPAVAALLAAGAAEVHVRGASPRRVRGCPYGVDAPVPDGLSDEILAARLGAASVASLSVPRMRAVVEALGRPLSTPCAACLGENWPLVPAEDAEQLPLFAG